MKIEDIPEANNLIYQYKDLTEQITQVKSDKSNKRFELSTTDRPMLSKHRLHVSLSKQSILDLLRKDRQRVRRKLTKLGVGKFV